MSASKAGVRSNKPTITAMHVSTPMATSTVEFTITPGHHTDDNFSGTLLVMPFTHANYGRPSLAT